MFTTMSQMEFRPILRYLLIRSCSVSHALFDILAHSVILMRAAASGSLFLLFLFLLFF